MKIRSVIDEANQIKLATEMVKYGARLQVLEASTDLSRERLLRLYKEVQGKSPPKGMLPFSTDWFLTWQPSIHASLFMGGYNHLVQRCNQEPTEALLGAYRLYLQEVAVLELEAKLSFTRAWILVRYISSSMLVMTPCKSCGCSFCTDPQDLNKNFICGLCNVPSRAGKTRQIAAEEE
jgi:flagellar transcriptional activator FlhC